MTIVGETSEGLLLSATRDEVAQLMGYRFLYETDRAGKFNSGKVISVHMMYEKLDKIRSLQKELDTAAADLRRAADLLQQTGPLLEAVNAGHGERAICKP